MNKEKIAIYEELIEVVNKSECPEKCRSGNIFCGYGGESGEEEIWEACPVCVKSSEYNPVVKSEDIISHLKGRIEELKNEGEAT